MNEPSPIRGWWTVFIDTFGRAFDVEDGVSPHAGMSARDGSQAVEAVPVPDEQAIERAAKAVLDAQAAAYPRPVEASVVARAVLAAALEQPE